jgi:cell division protein ZapA (FtsZ GTPase activity inhibitor)
MSKTYPEVQISERILKALAGIIPYGGAAVGELIGFCYEKYRKNHPEKMTIQAFNAALKEDIARLKIERITEEKTRIKIAETVYAILQKHLGTSCLHEFLAPLQMIPEILDRCNSILETMPDIESKTDFLLEKIDELNNIRPHLQIPFRKLPDIGDIANFRSDHLYFRYKLSPLLERDTEMSNLMEFANSDKPFSWWAVIGSGGSGKSRLALEWVETLCQDGWDAGFLSDSPYDEWLKTPDKYMKWIPVGPTAIVVDYAVRYADDIRKLVKVLSDRKFKDKVRILFLDRQKAAVPWFFDIMDKHRKTESDRLTAMESCYRCKIENGRHVPDVMELKPFENEKTLQELKDAFRQKFPNIQVDFAESLEWHEMESDSELRRPLYFQILLLCAERCDESGTINSDDVLNHWLEIEIRKWRDILKTGSSEINNKDEYLIVTLVGLITICRGIKIGEIRDLLEQNRPFNIEPWEIDHLLSKLQCILNVEMDTVLPLVPDPVAEQFVICGGKPDSASSIVFTPESLFEYALDANPKGFGEFIRIFYQDRAETHLAEQWIGNVFERFYKSKPDKVAIFLEESIEIALQAYLNETSDARAVINDMIARSENDRNLAVLLSKGLYTLSNIRFFSSDEMLKILEMIDEIPSKSISEDVALLHSSIYTQLCQDIVFFEMADSLLFDDIAQRNRKLWQQYPENQGIRLEEARSIFLAINYFGESKDFKKLEQWAKRLDDVIERFPEDKEIRLQEAWAIVLTVNYYGEATNFKKLEQWATRFDNVLEHFPDDREIRLEEAGAVTLAINYYGKAEKFEKLERWARHLDDVIERFPDDQEIRLTASRTIALTIGVYAKSQDFNKLEQWGKRLDDVIERFPDVREIRLEQAKAIFNAITDYGKAENFEKLEQWAKRLDDVIERFSDDQEIRLTEAKAIVNAINCYGEAKDFETLEQWAKRLDNVIERFPDDQEIRLEEAWVIIFATYFYGESKDFESLKQWANRLEDVIERFPDHQEIRMIEIKALFFSIYYYRRSKELETLELWATRLNNVIESFPVNQEIQRTEALAIGCVISVYGQAKEFEKLEQWAKRLDNVIEQFPDDQEINVTYLQTAARCVECYAESGQRDNVFIWLKMLETRFDQLSDNPDACEARLYAWLKICRCFHDVTLVETCLTHVKRTPGIVIEEEEEGVEIRYSASQGLYEILATSRNVPDILIDETKQLIEKTEYWNQCYETYKQYPEDQNLKDHLIKNKKYLSDLGASLM